MKNCKNSVLPTPLPDDGAAMLLARVFVVHRLVAGLGQGWEIGLFPEIDFLQTGQVGAKVKELLEQVLSAELPAQGLLACVGEHVASNEGLSQELSFEKSWRGARWERLHVRYK